MTASPQHPSAGSLRRWFGGRSIAGAMQLWHAGLLGVVLIGFGVATYLGFRQMTYQRVDAQLQQAVQLLASGVHPHGRGPDNPDDPHNPRPNQDHPPRWAGGNAGPGGGGGENWNGPPPNTDWSDGSPPYGRDGRGGGPWRGNRGEGPPDVALDLPPTTDALFGDVSHEGRLFAIVWRADGSILKKSFTADPGTLGLVAPPPTNSPRRGPPPAEAPTIQQRGEFREAVLHGPFDTRLVVGKSVAPEEATLRHAAILLLCVGAGVMMLGLAGGFALSRRVVRPIRTMTAVAGDISATNLSRRMEPADVPGELKELAGVLNDMFARLDEAFAQQTRFTADASHELRTPLAVIHTQLQLALSRERSAADYQKALATCLRASGRMKGLVDSLLLLAGADAGRLSLDRRRFDLADAARDCTAMVATLANEKHVTIETDLSSAAVVGDQARVEQVITNLLTNAIRYNRDGGKVTVAVAVENRPNGAGDALVRVTDTGVGIPLEHVGHLFERFYRVDPARSREAGGNGLGLAICKSIVEAHGGQIEVTSEVDVGTTFTVRLPAAEVLPAEPHA